MIAWLFSGHGQAVTSAVVLVAFAGLFLSRFGSPARWIAVALAATLLDQGVKALLLRTLPVDAYYRTLYFLHGLLRIRYYRNDSLGFEEPFPFLLVSTVVLGFFLLVLYDRLDRTEYRMAIVTEIGGGLVVGGLLGILLDRVRLGYVVDYILIGRLIYNLADMMTILGMAAITARVLEIGMEAHRKGLGLRDLVTARQQQEVEAAAVEGALVMPAPPRRSPSWALPITLLLLGAVLLVWIWQVRGPGVAG
jgi:signal peptidase II